MLRKLLPAETVDEDFYLAMLVIESEISHHRISDPSCVSGGVYLGVKTCEVFLFL